MWKMEYIAKDGKEEKKEKYMGDKGRSDRNKGKLGKSRNKGKLMERSRGDA